MQPIRPISRREPRVVAPVELRLLTPVEREAERRRRERERARKRRPQAPNGQLDVRG